jgi:hypothetical protein
MSLEEEVALHQAAVSNTLGTLVDAYSDHLGELENISEHRKHWSELSLLPELLWVHHFRCVMSGLSLTSLSDAVVLTLQIYAAPDSMLG